MSSPRETHISDLLPAYALNSLDTDEARQVANHLQTCDECYREFLEYQAVVDRLGFAASVMRPSPTLKARLTSRIRTVRSPHAKAEPFIPWHKRLFSPRISAAWLAATSIIVILVVADVWLAEELTRYANAALTETQAQTTAAGETLRAIQLTSTSAASRARGTLLVSSDGRKGMLVVDGLPGIAAARVYQAWLGEQNQPSSAGILNLSENGYGWVEIKNSLKPLHEYHYFGITIEPAGGSIFPTGDNVLAAYR